VGKKRTPVVIENRGSLMTYKDGKGRNCCLNFLLVAEGHGIYEPTMGRIDDITPEDAAAHNKALSKGLIDGLDDQCEIGQSGTFHEGYGRSRTGIQIITWNGDVVGLAIPVREGGKQHTLKRGDRLFDVKFSGSADSNMVTLTRIK
jgi:hypothetical protein